jgi:hypothetical protein
MRPVKALGAVAIAAIALTALLGASTAMASTALCKVAENPCAKANQVTEIHLVAEPVLIQTSLMNYECNALLSATVGELGETQSLTAQSLTYSSCNQGCTRTVNKLGKLILERTGSETAKISGSGFEIHVQCSGSGGQIDCSYAFNGLTGTALGASLTGDNGHFRFEESTLEKVGGLICPTVATLSGLFVASQKFYVES